MIRNKEVSQYKFLLQYSEVKRVSNVMITDGKVTGHENVANMSAGVLQSRCS